MAALASAAGAGADVAAAPAAAAAVVPVAAVAGLSKAQALALDLLSTYVERDNAAQWLRYAVAYDAYASQHAASAAAPSAPQQPPPVPPATLVTDMAPVRMFTRECTRRPWPMQERDELGGTANVTAALSWFVRVLLLVTTAQPPVRLINLTPAQRTTLRARDDLDGFEKALADSTYAYSAHGLREPTPPSKGEAKAVHRGFPPPHHLLWLNGFNARPEAMRPFGPTESPPCRTRIGNEYGRDAVDFNALTDVWVRRIDLQHPPLLLACMQRHDMAHALLDLPPHPLLQGGGAGGALNVCFIGDEGDTCLYHSCLSDRDKSNDPQLLQRLLAAGAVRSHATLNARNLNGAHHALFELLLDVRTGYVSAAEHVHALTRGSKAHLLRCIALWCGAPDDGGAVADDGSGLDLYAMRSVRKETLAQALELEVVRLSSSSITDAQHNAHLALWDRARAVVRDALQRVATYPARLTRALDDAAAATDRAPLGSPAAALLGVAPLRALITQYLLWSTA